MTKPTKRIRKKKAPPRKAPFIGQTAMEEAFVAARTAPAEELARIPPTDAERIAALEARVGVLVTTLDNVLPKLAAWAEAVDGDRKALFSNDQLLKAAIESMQYHTHPIGFLPVFLR